MVYLLFDSVGGLPAADPVVTRAAELGSLVSRTEAALECEIGFVGSQGFQLAQPAVVEESLVSSIEQGDCVREESDYLKTLPGHFLALCETPVLGPDDEAAAFRRMNYLKYRANVVRSGLNVEDADAEKMRSLDDLLLRANRLHDHIVKANMRLVISVAKKFVDPRNTFDDLFSEGVVALLRAVEKFDVERGFRFSTYATTAIRHQIYRWKTRDGRRQKEFATNADESLGAAQFSSDEAVMRDSATSRINEVLENMLSRLDARERLLISGRFGLDSSGVKATFASLGEQLKISKERARQITERAVNKLRLMAQEFGLDELEL